jgi:hypothetical protein
MLVWTICDDRPNLVKIDNHWHIVGFKPCISNRFPRCPRCKTDKPEHFLEAPSLLPELRLDWNHEEFVLIDCLKKHEILCQNCGQRHSELWRNAKLDEIQGNLTRWNPYQIVHPIQLRARKQKIEEIRNPMKNNYPVASLHQLKAITTYASYEAFLGSFRGINLYMEAKEVREVESWLEARFEGLKAIRKQESEVLNTFGKPQSSFAIEDAIAQELENAGL